MRKVVHVHSETGAAPRLSAVPESEPGRRGRPRAGERLSDLSNPADSYLAKLEASGQRSMRSRLDRAARILQLDSSVETFPWDTLNYEDVVRVRTRLSMGGTDAEKRVSSATINLTLIALRRVAREARRLGQMDPEVEAAIREVEPVERTAAPRGRMLSPEEKRALFAACAGNPSARGRRDACLLALMLGAGLRREECVGLEPAAVEDGGRSLRVRGKRGREAVLPLHAEAARAVADWMRVRGRGPGPLLAPVSWSGRVRAGAGLSGQDVYRAVLSLAARAGIDRCTPHDLRRTFISELLDSTDEWRAQRLARHASPQTTGRYDRRGERADRRAIAQLDVPYRPLPTRPRRRTKRRGKKGRGGRPRLAAALENRPRAELVELARAHRVEVADGATRAQLATAIRESLGGGGGD